ncbi:MAG: transposase zinc-binding domain-containing protein [Nitrospirae bacterium]|nr:transposase zinc-binding domain-containing protein [Nitrospirota bacterium]MBI4848774.1 transposase zinc-binding domain-containing protein [Nitrospirota bacterium]
MVELAEIFRIHGTQYRAKFGSSMLLRHLKVMRDIEECRTEAFGGHVCFCEKCGEKHYSYHSCKNRHCPKCQNDTAQKWLQKQQDLLLPVTHFMNTFTLPDSLRQLARSNQRMIYNILFKASAAALQKMALDPKYVGGEIGMMGILHTWTRDIAYHPHIHYIIPAGGLSADGTQWLSARGNFLMPVKALSIIFRAKFS